MTECCFVEEIPEAETNDRRDSYCRERPKDENSKQVEGNRSDKGYPRDDKIRPLFQVDLEKISMEDLDLSAEPDRAEKDRYQGETLDILGKVVPDCDREGKIEGEYPCPKNHKGGSEENICLFPGFAA